MRNWTTIFSHPVFVWCRGFGFSIVLISFLLFLAACGGGSSSPTPPPPPPPSPTITSVAVNTMQPLVRAGETANFSATVQGTGSFSSSVKWSVNGVEGGSATDGVISSSGTYSAPVFLPAPNTVTITATSVQDTTKSGTASATVYTLTLTPAAATVFYGHTQQFNAQVTGLTSPILQWSAGHGTVDSNGLYSAPTLLLGQNFNDSVSASVPSGGNSVSASITLQLPPPRLNSITPNGASANEPVTIVGRDFFGLKRIVFSGPNGSTIPTDFLTGTAPQVKAIVPPGAVTGPVYLETNAMGIDQMSNSITFNRFPNLRIRTSNKDLSSSETVQFGHRLLGAATPSAITFTASLGNISASGLYQAPVVTDETFVTVTGCLDNTRSCDSTMLRIVPFRITPDLSTVGLGQTLQLHALQGSSQLSATWSILAGGGNITTGGLFTAPTAVAKAGGIPIKATNGGTAALAPVAVTGAFPGIVSRTNDYFDAQNQVFEGTDVTSIIVNGNRLYALDLGIRFAKPFNENPPFTALESYDITDPIHPLWLDATEAIIPQPLLFGTYGHYVYEVDVSGQGIKQPSRIAVYDVLTTPPHLVSYAYVPELFFAYENQGVIYGAALANYTGANAPLYVFDIRSGTIIQSQLALPPPANTVVGGSPYIAIGAGDRLYAGFVATLPDVPAILGAYDTSVSPARLLGTAQLTGHSTRVSMFLSNNLLFVVNRIFDVSGDVPIEIGSLPTQDVQAIQGTRILGRGTQYTYVPDQNYKMVDISDPAHSITQSTFYDMPSLVSVRGQLLGNYVLGSDGLGGIITIDVSKKGGPNDKLRTGEFLDGLAFDQDINNQTLCLAGASGLGFGGIITYDLSTGTLKEIGNLLYGGAVAYAVRTTGSSAFVGFADSLKVVNISNPADPVETASLPIPTGALALSGNSLFVGTGDSRLLVMDVTNANSPVTRASVSLPGPAVTLKLQGSLLYVADGPKGLLVYDVSNLSAPVRLSQFQLTTPIWDSAPVGSLALLAADSDGLVIVDVSNPVTVKQISQTTLESYRPFVYRLTQSPRSSALSVTANDGIAYVGTLNSAGLIFGFDYGQPANPRVVSVINMGEFIDTLITNVSFSGTDMYVAGLLGVVTNVSQVDITTPRNMITPYYPPDELRVSTFSKQPAGDRLAAQTPHHPKFDKSMWQKKRSLGEMP